MTDGLLYLAAVSWSGALWILVAERRDHEATGRLAQERAELMAALMEREELRYAADRDRALISRSLEGALTYCEVEEL